MKNSKIVNVILEKINEAFDLNRYNTEYRKWKRENVTLRGMGEIGEENGGGAILGRGLYTAPLSNKAMAKEYGKVYFVVNGKPKHPLIVRSLNEWEIYRGNLITKVVGKYSPQKFEEMTSIEQELQKMGYDGVVIKGREMVVFNPKDVRYYENERQLNQYFEILVYNQ